MLNRLAHSLTSFIVCSRISCLGTLFVLALARSSLAQFDDENPLAPADTSSPRATLMTFIHACNDLQQTRLEERYFDPDNPEHSALAKRILDCLDASELPDYEQRNALAEAAVCIKEVLDRVEIPHENEIPGPDDLVDEEGQTIVDRWQLPGTRIFIHLVEEGAQKHEYVFTPGTVARAVESYRDFAGLDYRDSGPDVSPGLYRWYISAPADPTMARLVAWLPAWTKDRVLNLAIWQ